MPVMERLNRLDERLWVYRPLRRGRSSLEPAGSAARARWEWMAEEHRTHAVELARLGLVARDPDLAVVVADLADQVTERLLRKVRWLILGVALLFVAAIVAAIVAGWELLSPPVLGSAIGGVLGVALTIRRSDLARRRNEAAAREAGLLD